MTLTAFDAYRDKDARTLMIDFVMRQRALDPIAATAALRGLNHVGLAYVYRDALGAQHRASIPDYDPCAAGRL
jgi:hypothetical protein